MSAADDCASREADANPPAAGWKRAVGLALPAGFSIALLAALCLAIGAADLKALVSALALGEVLAPIGLFALAVALNGLRLRALSGSSPTEAGGWLRVAALHQGIVMLAPAGAGDLAFPLIAGRAGISPVAAVRVLLTYRVQDLWVLAAFGATALAIVLGGLPGQPVLLAATAMLVVGCLYFSDGLTRTVLRWVCRGCTALAGRRHRPRLAERLKHAAEVFDQGPCRLNRAAAAMLTLAGWAITALALHLLFHAVAFDIPISHTLLLLAGLNAIGATAFFTMAGLGISEAGLAGMLIALGAADPERALAVALVVRPASLVCLLAASALVALASVAVRWVSSGSKRRFGTTAA